MFKEAVAEIVFDVSRHANEDDAHPILKQAFERRENHQQHGQPQYFRDREAAGQRIDAGAKNQRLDSGGDVLYDERAHTEKKAAAVAPQIR